MENILKKYCRAAGDRSQWKKVEAMFDTNGRRRKRVFEGCVSRGLIPMDSTEMGTRPHPPIHPLRDLRAP